MGNNMSEVIWWWRTHLSLPSLI